jgi:hypothetical protein
MQTGQCLKATCVPRLPINAAAVFAILLMVLLVGVQMGFNQRTIEPEVKELIKNHVAADFQRYYLSKNNISAADKAKVLSAIQLLSIDDISARGKGANAVVRIELAPSKVQPPGTTNIQYHRIKRSELTGWHHDGQVSAFQYYLPIF